nr:nucleotide-binding, alpha-beta plait [Tanacetum cinerariifolium]
MPYDGRSASYDRTIGDGGAELVDRYDGCAAIYGRTTGDREPLLGDRYGGSGSSYDRTTSDGEALLGDRSGDHGASYGGMGSSREMGVGTASGGSGQRSRYFMSPRSMRGFSGCYPESTHYSLSASSADQIQQSNKSNLSAAMSNLAALTSIVDMIAAPNSIVFECWDFIMVLDEKDPRMEQVARNMIWK